VQKDFPDQFIDDTFDFITEENDSNTPTPTNSSSENFELEEYELDENFSYGVSEHQNKNDTNITSLQADFDRQANAIAARTGTQSTSNNNSSENQMLNSENELAPAPSAPVILLNQRQQEAADSLNQQILVLAGAGTGKTRVIIKRIERLVKEGVEPNKIVVTTFTNKAAAELRHRLAATVGNAAYSIVCGTFHKISAQFLRVHGNAIGLDTSFQLLNDDDQIRLVKRLLKTLDIEKTPRSILEQISQFKETGKKPYEKAFDIIFDMYESELQKNNYLDYSNLIQKATELFEMRPEIADILANYVLIDEYQDINRAQYKWIILLSKNKNLFCVGDEDQSIYSFRGSSIEYIQKFNKDFPNAHIIQLEENYRSAEAILTGATRLIRKNTKAFEKKLIAMDKEKEGYLRVHKVFNEFEEAAMIANLAAQWKQKNPEYKIAVLVRTNMQVYPIEHAFVESKIPYNITSGKKFYMKREIQDIISYLRILISPQDFLAFARVLNSPKRNMGDVRLNMLLDAMKSLDCSFENALSTLLHQLPRNAGEKCKILLMQIQNWRSLKDKIKLPDLIEKILNDIQYRTQEEFTPAMDQSITNLKEHTVNAKSLEDFLENLQFLDSEEESNDIQIMTMHGAKGLEFDIVIAPGWEENVFPSPLARDKAELEEERRLAYVTITRAKQYLEIIHTCSRRINGQYKHQMPSRFIFDL